MAVARSVFLSVVLVLSLASPATAQPMPLLIPPVDAPVVHRFDPPDLDWGPGHRGVDYDVAPGTAIRAAAAGTVAFAGVVAGIRAVTIEHTSGLETTYSQLSEVLVSEGDSVTAGTWIGRAGRAHPAQPGLHFAVKLDGRYVDPEAYFGPVDLAGAIHLAPVVWRPSTEMPSALRELFAVKGAGTYERACEESEPLRRDVRPPNHNVAVALAGIGSSTNDGVHAHMYEHGPELLGYPPQRVYRFSYRGTSGRRLHTLYDSTDTFGDLRAAAAKLGDLLEEIATRHPGRDVDLIAHSQGGIVARSYLEFVANEWDGHLPRIDHVVTFAAPHSGAPLAGVVEDLDHGSITGPLATHGVGYWARRGGPIPDPHSDAVSQLAPNSRFMTELAEEDVLFGTRALALAIPNDLVVPADRALWRDQLSRVVPPGGWNGHAAIVSSDVARAMVHAFLRDDAPPCGTNWDDWGRHLGRVVSVAETKLPWLYSKVEAKAIDVLAGVPGAGEAAQQAVSLLRDAARE